MEETKPASRKWNAKRKTKFRCLVINCRRGGQRAGAGKRRSEPGKENGKAEAGRQTKWRPQETKEELPRILIVSHGTRK